MVRKDIAGLLILGIYCCWSTVTALTFGFHLRQQRTKMSAASSSHPTRRSHISFCDLPGDPSLILTTNIDLGPNKLKIMKELSKAVAEHTGKPEEYVAVSVTDKADVMFGGTTDPAALACLYSIGSIGASSNGAITKAVTSAIGVPPDRIYINFFDVPPANVGWNGGTFADTD